MMATTLPYRWRLDAEEPLRSTQLPSPILTPKAPRLGAPRMPWVHQ
jgi:hypothetical protein